MASAGERDTSAPCLDQPPPAPGACRETFVNAFEVSNKVVELLMLRAGCEVCCTSPQDRSAIQRYEQQLREERAGQPQ